MRRELGRKILKKTGRRWFQAALAAAVLVLLPVVLSACGAPSKTTKKPNTPPAAGKKSVSFVTADGVKLRGYLFGRGRDGVVLAHMYPADQTSWFPFAAKLAAAGYSVLTFDFRGYGESDGSQIISEIDKDETAALAFMKRRHKKIFLIGASMGGTAALKTAAGRRLRGVISLSAPIAFQGLSAQAEIKKIKAPKLFLASRNDPAGAAAAARWFYDNSSPPKQIQVYSGSDHGTNILKGPNAKKAERKLINFLKKYR